MTNDVMQLYDSIA